MNDINVTAATYIMNAVDWNTVNSQAIVEAGKSGHLNSSIAEWLTANGFKKEKAPAPEEVKVYLERLFETEKIFFNGREIAVFELVANATFSQMLGPEDEKRPRWEKKEALAFAEQNKERLGPNANFFEVDGGSVFNVLLAGSGPLKSSEYPFSDDFTWFAKSQHRVFLPL